MRRHAGAPVLKLLVFQQKEALPLDDLYVFVCVFMLWCYFCMLISDASIGFLESVWWFAWFNSDSHRCPVTWCCLISKFHSQMLETLDLKNTVWILSISIAGWIHVGWPHTFASSDTRQVQRPLEFVADPQPSCGNLVLQTHPSRPHLCQSLEII